MDEYAKSAQDFRQKGLANMENIDVKVYDDGVTRMYDKENNVFASYNPDGSTKTYFKPSNKDTYWDNQ